MVTGTCRGFLPGKKGKGCFHGVYPTSHADLVSNSLKVRGSQLDLELIFFKCKCFSVTKKEESNIFNHL